MSVASEGLRSTSCAHTLLRACCSAVQPLPISISRSSVVSVRNGPRWTAQSCLKYTTPFTSVSVEDYGSGGGEEEGREREDSKEGKEG